MIKRKIAEIMENFQCDELEATNLLLQAIAFENQEIAFEKSDKKAKLATPKGGDSDDGPQG